MAKTLAMVFGIVFVIVGLLGFVPNPIVGMDGIFATNLTHDLVHLIIGVVLLGVAMRMPESAGMWLKIIGVVYLVVAALGFVMTSPLLGIIEVNSADNWLHVVLGVVLLASGFAGGSSARPMNAPMGGGMPM